MKHFLLSLTEIVTPLIYRIYVLQSYLKFFLLRLATSPTLSRCRKLPCFLFPPESADGTLSPLDSGQLPSQNGSWLQPDLSPSTRLYLWSLAASSGIAD